MKIPTTEECMKLLDEFEVPENLRKHCFVVNKVSMILAKELNKAGEDVNIDLLNAASLLHDIDKIKTLKDNNKHGELSREWLSKKGYNEVGELVKKHLLLHLIKSANLCWEDKIINYADKRCVDDKIVSLKERLNHLKKKYSEYFKKEYEEKALEIEKEIFDKINIKPEDLR